MLLKPHGGFDKLQEGSCFSSNCPRWGSPIDL